MNTLRPYDKSIAPKIFVRAASKAPFLISINQIYDLCKLSVLFTLL